MPMSFSRRSFLQATALALPATTLPGCSGFFTEASTNNADQPVFFNTTEYQFIEAATSRLIPSDANGPGAKEAKVAVFIDRQLGGSYGRAETWYMQGPWKEGTEQQGYQSKLTPAQLYRAAIRNIEAYCQQEHQQSFVQLPLDQQDALLHGLEKGELELTDVDAKSFFEMLLQNTTEGFLADPMYGGNRNFAGWKLIGFPGPRYNYVEDIERYGERYPLPTVGLLGRDGSRTGVL